MSDDLNRRSFMRRTSMGAAAVGALAVTGGSVFGDVSSANASTDSTAQQKHEGPLLDGDLVAHVINARTGEMSILVGSREVKFINRDVAQQLMRATK